MGGRERPSAANASSVRSYCSGSGVICARIDVPVRVTVVERPVADVGLSAGYGTDSGVRGEVSLRYRNAFGRGYDMQSAVQADAKRQIGSLQRQAGKARRRAVVLPARAGARTLMATSRCSASPPSAAAC